MCLTDLEVLLFYLIKRELLAIIAITAISKKKLNKKDATKDEGMNSRKLLRLTRRLAPPQKSFDLHHSLITSRVLYHGTENRH